MFFRLTCRSIYVLNKLYELGGVRGRIFLNFQCNLRKNYQTLVLSIILLLFSDFCKFLSATAFCLL